MCGVDNAELADWIHRELEWDQLIVEYYVPGEPNSGWIHCSITEGTPRKQFLHAYRDEGKTKYKPILGKAKDIYYEKKQEKIFADIIKKKKAKMVDGVCPHCTEHTLLISVCK